VCYVLLRSSPKPLEDQTKNIGCTFLSWCCLIYLRTSLTASPACTPNKCSIKMKVGHRWNYTWQTALSRILPEKPTIIQLVEKFPTFFWTRMFITAFTSVRHLSLSWTRPIESLSPPHISWTSILILSLLRQGFQVVTFPQVSSPKPDMHLSCLPYVPHAPPISFFLIWSSEYYLVRSTIVKLLVV